MSYFPITRAGIIAWLKNAIAKLPAEAARLNEPAADVEAILAEMQSLLNAYETAELAKANVRATNASTTELEKAVTKRAKGFMQRLKGNPLCTDETKKILLIYGSSAQKDTTHYTPEITAVQTGGRIRLSFKRRRMHGINLYCRLAGESNFKLLATIMKSPWFDDRPLVQEGVTEMREYYAMAVQYNVEVGQPSAVAAVAFRG